VIDAANVGLFMERNFTPSRVSLLIIWTLVFVLVESHFWPFLQVNLIANGIRQKLSSKKWPLIVLHNRRITGRKMNEAVNRTLIEKWKNGNALYATPTGSNDDWWEQFLNYDDLEVCMEHFFNFPVLQVLVVRSNQIQMLACDERWDARPYVPTSWKWFLP